MEVEFRWLLIRSAECILDLSIQGSNLRLQTVLVNRDPGGKLLTVVLLWLIQVLTYTTQDHLPRVGTTHNGLDST